MSDADANDADPTDDAAPADAPGELSRTVLEYVAKSIVDDPDRVEIEADPRPGSITLRLHVSPDDMGKVIGKRGRVAQAIRTVVRAAGAKEGTDAIVDIVD